MQSWGETNSVGKCSKTQTRKNDPFLGLWFLACCYSEGLPAAPWSGDLGTPGGMAKGFWGGMPPPASRQGRYRKSLCVILGEAYR